MKRFVLIIALLGIAGIVYGAANVARFVTRPIVASKAVTGQWSATTWTLVDSIRLLQAGDSSCSAIQVQGEVDLQPGQELWLGFGHTVATKTVADLDTFVLKGNPSAPNARIRRVPFIYRYTRNDSVAVNDTFYCVAAQNVNGLTLTMRNVTLSVQTGMPNSSGKLAERF